jgi:DNA adenine methylase
MGSKARVSKHIAPIIESFHSGGSYYEPFLGGGNMFSNVNLPDKYGSDTCEYAVALLEAISKGWEPPDVVSEEFYHSVKANSDSYSKELVGFLAYSCSYAGKFWGGYARGNTSKGSPRNFASEQVRNLGKQRFGLVGANFSVCSYNTIDLTEGDVVYCDPPYLGTTGYSKPFDHGFFWDWCAKKVSQGITVLVSEYYCPVSNEVLWAKEQTSSLTKDTGSKKSTEVLFRIR